jgi:hypothetical protein
MAGEIDRSKPRVCSLRRRTVTGQWEEDIPTREIAASILGRDEKWPNKEPLVVVAPSCVVKVEQQESGIRMIVFGVIQVERWEHCVSTAGVLAMPIERDEVR